MLLLCGEWISLVKVGVVGATGYTAAELLRILALHPGVAVSEVYSTSRPGELLAEVVPHLASFYPSLRLQEFDPAACRADCYFVCVPHGKARPYVEALLKTGARVVDLSADFRLKKKELYEPIYGIAPPPPDLAASAVYGMPEYRAAEIKDAQLVANPGCLARAAILALRPFFAAELVEGSVFIDAKTGVSGAGRSPRADLHFPAMNEDFRPYRALEHRHQPEIEQELATDNIAFVPHLLPVDRGILVSAYFCLKEETDPLEVLKQAYQGSEFIEVRSALPCIKEVRGTNRVLLSARRHKDKAAVFCALDNLTAGAAGNAVHCFNLMFGFSEAEGLRNLTALNP